MSALSSKVSAWACQMSEKWLFYDGKMCRTTQSRQLMRVHKIYVELVLKLLFSSSHSTHPKVLLAHFGGDFNFIVVITQTFSRVTFELGWIYMGSCELWADVKLKYNKFYLVIFCFTAVILSLNVLCMPKVVQSSIDKLDWQNLSALSSVFASLWLDMNNNCATLAPLAAVPATHTLCVYIANNAEVHILKRVKLAFKCANMKRGWASSGLQLKTKF